MGEVKRKRELQMRKAALRRERVRELRETWLSLDAMVAFILILLANIIGSWVMK